MDQIEQAPNPTPEKSDQNSFVFYGNKGSYVGKYLQTPPIIFSRDGHSMWFGDMYRGRCGFLILSGPSFNDINHKLLDKPGILTMGVNNSVKTYRPNLWTSVDHPSHFIKSIWLDPKIMKFIPYCNANINIFDNEKWKETDIKTSDCPNCWFYRRNATFNAKQFLFENTINWGNNKEGGGGRSVVLVAIRLMFYLGIRTLFLLGCDFRMDEKNHYHFEQNRSQGSISGNNATYKMLIDRFKELKPIFEDIGFNIYNCSNNSNLDIFQYIPFNEAINIANCEMPDIANERTAGLYERSLEKNKND